MTWADFYLICFAVGFAFSVLSFLLGATHWHWPFPMRLPFGVPRLPVGPHVHIGGHVHTGNRGQTHGGAVSQFNPMTITAFLAWFGGTGYLLARFSTVEFVLAFGLAMVAGLVAATLIFWFMTRVLLSQEENMNPADYEMAGVLGRVSSSIREGGTGELIYSQAGTRRACGARSEDGRAIAKGEEVVVTRYEKGIAYVRRWEELTKGPDSYGSAADQAQPS